MLLYFLSVVMILALLQSHHMRNTDSLAIITDTNIYCENVSYCTSTHWVLFIATMIVYHNVVNKK